MGVPEGGERLAGRYIVGGQIGAGGMGVVLRARDEKLNRSVAIKVLPAGQLGDEQARERLIREARAAAQLDHPGIVQVFDVGETDDGDAFLVMEMVRGQTLRARLREGPFEQDLALGIVTSVAEALAAAHAVGLVHRDVKPDNIMLREDGRVVLLDFGLVKLVGTPLTDSRTPDTPTIRQLTESGALVGTPAYLAPEQARGRSGPATDQWALAVTAFELLTGRLPWEGEDVAFMLAQILLDPPASASEVGELPPAVDDVIARGLSKDPEERFPDVSAFALALEVACRSGAETTSATSEAPAASVGDPQASSPPTPKRLAAMGAIALVSLGIATLVWQSQSDETEDDTPSAPLVTPLADPESIFACPLFEADGVEEPSGWFGAAGSVSVCRRIAVLMGGDEGRMLTAAHLLDVPRLPTADFPHRPYVEPDARARTLAAARERAVAWIDGRVRRVDDGRFEIEVRLEAEAGEIARATGEGEALHLAADVAVRALIEQGAVPAAEQLIPEVREWTLLEDPEHLLMFYDSLDTLFTHVDGVEFCERAFRELPAFEVALVDGDCAEFVDRPEFTIELDHSTPFALAVTGLAYMDRTPGADPDAIADVLAAARQVEPSARGRAWLARNEGMVRIYGGQLDRAGPILRVASEGLPLDWDARIFSSRAEEDPVARSALMRTLQVWRPDLAEATGTTPPGASLEDRVAARGRAHALAPRNPGYAVGYATLLTRIGRLEDARSIAARLRVRPSTELAGLLVDAIADLRVGRFVTAEQKLRASLAAATRPFGVLNGDTRAFGTLLRLADLLGRSREVADELVQEYALADPPRVTSAESFYERSLIMACTYASPDVADAGLDALVRLRETHTSGRGVSPGVDAHMAGARAYAHGDMAGAVAAWRPLLRQAGAGYIPVSAFDAGGAPELGRFLDERHLQDEMFGGAHPAQAREAQRCADEGDHACARRHATRIVQAWSTVDAPVPMVAQMQELLASLPPEAD